MLSRTGMLRGNEFEGAKVLRAAALTYVAAAAMILQLLRLLYCLVEDVTSKNLRKNPREISLDIIMDITESKEKGNKFSHIVISKALKNMTFRQTRSFFH